MNIDLVGSNGFIGKTLQKVNAGVNLRSWSHSATNQARKFDLYDQNSWKNLLDTKPENVRKHKRTKEIQGNQINPKTEGNNKI